MLLCRDDRVRALRQVLAAEVNVSLDDIALRFRGRDVGLDEDTTMDSLEIPPGSRLLITRRIPA
jgi:hypothetical protein